MKKSWIPYFVMGCWALPFLVWGGGLVLDKTNPGITLGDPGPYYTPFLPQENFVVDSIFETGDTLFRNSLSREEAQKVGLQKKRLFQEYLELISSETQETVLIDVAINDAMKLFLGKMSHVTVFDSLKNSNESYRIRDFLNNVRGRSDLHFEVKEFRYSRTFLTQKGPSIPFSKFPVSDFIVTDFERVDFSEFTEYTCETKISIEIKIPNLPTGFDPFLTPVYILDMEVVRRQ